MADESLDSYQRLFEGMLEPEGYVGASREDAEDRARQEGFEVRVIDPSQGGLLTADLRSRRINLLVIDGRVRKAGVF